MIELCILLISPTVVFLLPHGFVMLPFLLHSLFNDWLTLWTVWHAVRYQFLTAWTRFVCHPVSPLFLSPDTTKNILIYNRKDVLYYLRVRLVAEDGIEPSASRVCTLRAAIALLYRKVLLRNQKHKNKLRGEKTVLAVFWCTNCTGFFPISQWNLKKLQVKKSTP